ncbi:MAG TPA: hypothetical protein VFU02_17210 [Polyangiaceae bacterium]|nr:hypothetical protein [Polyangiaceae bacterium]
MNMLTKVVPFCLLFAGMACSGAASGPAGAEAPTSTEKFTYAPVLDKRFHHTQRRYEEVSIPGSPMRRSEEWIMEWDVVTKQESNLFRATQRLVGLKININGLELLKGDEIKDDMVAVDIVTDKDSNVVDVRGADQLSEALVALAAPEAKPQIARIFSPERLKALGVARSLERHADLVGRPSKVGSQWMANDPVTGGTKEVRVVAEEACGARTCLRVVRQYDADRQAIRDSVAAQVKADVEAKGGDPSKVDVVGMEIKHEDTLLIDPATMEYHGANFIQNATVAVAGPEGQLQVAFKLERQSTYKY